MDGLDSVPYCKLCLAESHTVSKFPFIPPQLRAKFLHSRKTSFETPPKQKLSFYRPTCGCPSPSFPNNRLSTLATTHSKRAHHHSLKERAKGESPLRTLANPEPNDAQRNFIAEENRYPEEEGSSKPRGGKRNTNEAPLNKEEKLPMCFITVGGKRSNLMSLEVSIIQGV